MFDTYWLWAFLTMFSFFMDLIAVNSKRIGSKPFFGFIFVSLPSGSRLILVLPFIEQPRFHFTDLTTLSLGFPILILGLFFAVAPVYHLGIINPFTRPERTEKLQTDGLYGIIRHPILFGEAIWPFGWSIIFKSIPGFIFSFVWLTCLYLFTYTEEERLIEEHGETYTRYKQQVPRFFPRFRI
ncbi:MAG: methyltransferase family protein [Candidatus Heimdallarchaeota archaeon]